MAFTGVPVITLVSDGLCRITGISLGDAAAGTISLKGGAGEIKLPEAFKPREYKNAKAADVSLQDSIEISYGYLNPSTVIFPVMVEKAGTTPTDFLATLTNTAPGESGDTGELEIYVRHH